MILTIGGVDRTSVLVEDSLSVEQQAADFVTICSLVLLDENGDIAIADEDEITVVDGATTFFAGRVVDIRYSLFTTTCRYIHIKCQDKSAIVNETIVDIEEIYPDDHPGITADSDIINDLFDTYLPAVDSETYVDTIQDPLSITFGPCTLRSALSQICTRTGGYFYVDFDNKLHYFESESEGVAWFLSDIPDQVDSFSYFDAIEKHSTATTRLDGVFVVGDGVSGWRGTHAPGDRQGIARDNRITTSTGVNERGDAVLARYGNAQITYTVSTYKAGLRAGMDVRFVNALYGVDDTLTVRKMTVRWDKDGTPYYTLTLGDAVNPSLVQERNWTDTLGDALGPITSPRLPTSSRGWSHDLVFTATDNDTVEWTIGTIYLADGSTYAIDAGNTGNMAAVTYIFLDLDTSETVLQITTAANVAVGTKKVMVAVAENVEAGKDAVFQVFGGAGQAVLVTADHIAANTITANEVALNALDAGCIASGAITTDELAAGAVTAVKIAAGTITADKLEMGLGDSLFNSADGLLLLGPYCRISATEYESLRKQKASITGAFHQEAGRWVGTRALVVEREITNWIKNPSIETNTTGWAQEGSTISRDTTCSVFGSACLKVVTGGAAGGEGTYSIVTDETLASTQYTLSCYLKGNGTVLLRIWDSVDGYKNSGVITLTPTWTRYAFTATYGTGAVRSVAVMTNVTQATTLYCDGFQLEGISFPTSYCDGSLGSGYSWSGAAHASISTREGTTFTIPTGGNIKATEGAVALWFKVLEWNADGGMLFSAGNVNAEFDAYVTPTGGVYFLINGALRCSAGAGAITKGTWHLLVLNWRISTDTSQLYLNGELVSEGTCGGVAPTLHATMGIGYSSALGTHTYDLGGPIAQFTTFNRILTTVEVAGIYALQRPMVDVGSIDNPGIYILDGKFRIVSSTTGARMELDETGLVFKDAVGTALVNLDAANASFSLKSAASGARIEISPVEIAGYDGVGTKQFYLQASDGKAVAGAGAVILDEKGITFTAVNADASRVKWGTDFATISAYTLVNTNYMWLKMFASGDYDKKTVIYMVAEGQGAHDDAEFGLVSEDNDDFSQVYARVGGNLNLQVKTNEVVLGASGINVRPTGHKTQDLGLEGTAWDDCWADDFQNVADLFILGHRRDKEGKIVFVDDLAILMDIKGSGQWCERSGLELIDDDTLPSWVFTKDKKTKEIVYDPDGRPWISSAVVTSLTWGAIRQLAERVESLEGKQ